MTDDEFDSFLAHCVDRLEGKQADLQDRFGLGELARWDFDQETGSLRFSDSAGIVEVEAEVTPIGSFSTTGLTWMWSWANRSLIEPFKGRATRLEELYDLTGSKAFRMESFEADEVMSWEFAAMAVEYLNAEGCYRGPVGHLHVFLAIDEIRFVDSRSTDS